MSIKVVSLVLNDVSRDARVLKVADSLANLGYQSEILGVMTKVPREEFERRTSGATIRRTHAPVQVYYHFIKRAMLALGLTWGLTGTCLFALYLKELFPTGFITWALASILGLTGLLNRNKIRPFMIHHIPRLLRRRANWFIEYLFMKHLVRVLEEIQPDVVHCNDFNMLPAGAAYKKRTSGRVKVVYDSHEIYEEMSGRDPAHRERIVVKQAELANAVDAFMTVNAPIQKYLNEKYPALPRGRVVYNATPKTDVPKYDGCLHTAVDLTPQTRILLFQGGFAKNRGLEKIVRLATYLPDDWALVMMGWGPIEEELANLAAELGISGSKVKFCPGVPQDQLPLWTAGASLGVIPYENTCLNHWYCSPNKLWEYPRSGVPILASDFPVLRQFINEHDLGWTSDFSEESFTGLFNAPNFDIDLELKSQSAAAFSQNHTWEESEQVLKTIYAELLQD